MQHHKVIVRYFKKNGVSAIFLFRKNLLRRMISLLANSHDKSVKPLNGTHKSHVHSSAEVPFSALTLICMSLLAFAYHPVVVNNDQIAGSNTCKIQANYIYHATDS